MKNNLLFVFALSLFNISIFTDFLPYNTVIKFIALILLIINFSLSKKRTIAISPLFKPLLWLNFIIIINSLVGGDLSFIAAFTINALSILLAVQSPTFAKTEIKIMSTILVVHLIFAFFVELAPSSVVDEIFSKIILNGFNSNYSWRNIAGINVGLTNQPGVLAMYMVSLSAVFFSKYCNKKKISYIIGFILSTAIILLTTKRSAILFSVLSLTAVSLIFAGRKIKKHLNKHFGKYVLFSIIGALLSFELDRKFDLYSGILEKNEALLESNDLSNGRFSIWEDAISYYSSKPIFGIGLKNYHEISGYDVHNTYIQFLVEAGIVGFVVLITSVLKILIGSIAGLKRKYKDGLSGMDTPTIAGVYLLFFLIMYGFVGNTFIDYAPMSLFMISVGLIDSDLYPKEKKA